MPMDATVSVRNDAVTAEEHYRYAAPYRDAGDDTSPEPETESGVFYACIHHERELNKSARIHLFSNAAHLTLTLLTYRGPVTRACWSLLQHDDNGSVFTIPKKGDVMYGHEQEGSYFGFWKNHLYRSPQLVTQ